MTDDRNDECKTKGDAMPDVETFDIPNVATQMGITLNVQLVYKIYGTLSPARSK